MVTEQNKAVIRRFYEEVFNQGKYDVLDEICAPGYTNHSPNNPPGVPNNREGLRQVVMMYRNAFPDLHFTIEDMVAEGDLVMCRWNATGTHRGELFGIAPTGKRAAITGTDLECLENGQIVEGWAIADLLGLLQQLGVIPIAPAAQPQASSPMRQEEPSAGRDAPAPGPSPM